MRKLLLSTALLVCLPATGFASDLAMIIANENYDEFSDVSRGDDAAQASDALAAAGFEVFTRSDASALDVRAVLSDFLTAAPSAERIVITLTGRFIHSERETWLLPVDAENLGLADLPAIALPVSTVLTVLGDHPGRALLVLGPDKDEGDLAPYLRAGLGAFDIPQGVTVLTGSPRDVADFAEDRLTRPGLGLVAAADRAGLDVAGYRAADLVFLPRAEDAPAGDPDTSAQQVFWDAASAMDTEVAYQTYLERYPTGPNAQEASSRIQAIRAEPGRQAREAEDALNLTRTARREIQRDLALLGYDTRGIDGIFGNGTRRAVTTWQSGNGYAASGFLTREQIVRLDAQADRRAAELEAQAEQRRARQEQEDRAYWTETGAAGDEPGLRTYLNRYPDGVFAEIAQERLDLIQDQKRAHAAAQDRQAWDRAVQMNSQRGYQEYIAGFPNGAFVPEAKARQRELGAAQHGATGLKTAKATEAALQLDKGTRKVIEQRLNKMGFKPGPVDGEFDKKTRRAIRRYQTSRDLEPTGYLTQTTVVQIMADGLFAQ